MDKKLELADILCFKSNLDAVKSKVGPVNEYFRTRHSLPPNLVSMPPLVSAPPISSLQCFKSDFDAVKSKVSPINDYIRTCHSMTPKLSFHTPLSVCSPF